MQLLWSLLVALKLNAAINVFGRIVLDAIMGIW